MREITLEQLLEAGCHFGHQVTRHNPRAKEFIFEARDGIHIIDLAKTKEGLDAAAVFVLELAKKEDSSIIVIGTKRQAQILVEKEVTHAQKEIKKEKKNPNIFFVNARWMGGTLTNFSEVVKNSQKLKDLTALLANEFERIKYTKKELGLFEKERQKLEKLYGGVAGMNRLPDALFIIDTHFEKLAVLEARRMKIPTVGIVDTNADPAMVTYDIDANDDAAGSLKLLIGHIIDAWVEGKTGAEPALRQDDTEEKNKSKKEEPAKKDDEKTVKSA